MPGKTNSTRDAFGFSLMGLRAASSFTTAMAVADDGINAAWDERLSGVSRQFVQLKERARGHSAPAATEHSV